MAPGFLGDGGWLTWLLVILGFKEVVVPFFYKCGAQLKKKDANKVCYVNMETMARNLQFVWWANNNNNIHFTAIFPAYTKVGWWLSIAISSTFHNPVHPPFSTNPCSLPCPFPSFFLTSIVSTF